MRQSLIFAEKCWEVSEPIMVSNLDPPLMLRVCAERTKNVDINVCG